MAPIVHCRNAADTQKDQDRLLDMQAKENQGSIVAHPFIGALAHSCVGLRSATRRSRVVEIATSMAPLNACMKRQRPLGRQRPWY
jgi:hypothetical protein